MDASTEATATNIIRFNQNGIGFSTDGGATYSSAWTIDGHFNADFITAGTMVANRVRAGLLTDETGDNSWNLDTGEFTTTKGTIGGFTIDDTDLRSTHASITPNGITFFADDPNNPGGKITIGVSSTSFYAFMTDAGQQRHTNFVIDPTKSGSYYGVAFNVGENGPNFIMIDLADTTSTSHNQFSGGVYADKLEADEIQVNSGGKISVGSSEVGLSADLLLSPLSGTGTGYISYTAGKYSAYMFIGRASSLASANLTLIVPDALMNGQDWQLADETNFYKFNINGGTLTGLSGSGYISYVYGLY